MTKWMKTALGGALVLAAATAVPAAPAAAQGHPERAVAYAQDCSRSGSTTTTTAWSKGRGRSRTGRSPACRRPSSQLSRPRGCGSSHIPAAAGPGGSTKRRRLARVFRRSAVLSLRLT